MRITFTAEDRAFLAEGAIAVGDEGPVPMVDAAKYVAAVDARDRALGEVYRLRVIRQGWRRRYRGLRRVLVFWQCLAAAAGAGLVAAWVGRIGW